MANANDKDQQQQKFKLHFNKREKGQRNTVAKAALIFTANKSNREAFKLDTEEKKLKNLQEISVKRVKKKSVF